ncbi:MAG: hypothetical protein EOP93_20890 [Lysobacteraceae bacterium]|nr:MAG: hypothetical protein EOP93_20890 [Xanthomonadaceae bacterium]
MKNFRLLSSLVLATTTTLMAGGALAQSTPKLDEREAQQQQRIDKGEASGQLTSKEAARLEVRDARLDAHEAAAKSDGKVTRMERARLQREAQRNSRAIRNQKHDRQRTPAG